MLPNHDLKGLMRLVWPFFAVLLVFWGFSVYWWTTMGYHPTFLWFNQYHIPALDQSMLYFFTHLGDGLILPMLAIVFFWRKDPALAISLVIAVLVTGLLAQIGKNVLFENWVRPPVVFQDLPGFTTVHPDPPLYHSFPSGHATSIATGGIFFAYLLGLWRRWAGAIVGVFTIFLCFSRVVIGVHFPGDLFVGSMIGSIGGLLLLRWLYPVLHPRMHRLRGDQRKLGTVIAFSVAGVAITARWIHIFITT